MIDKYMCMSAFLKAEQKQKKEKKRYNTIQYNIGVRYLKLTGINKNFAISNGLLCGTLNVPSSFVLGSNIANSKYFKSIQYIDTKNANEKIGVIIIKL